MPCPCLSLGLVCLAPLSSACFQPDSALQTLQVMRKKEKGRERERDENDSSVQMTTVLVVVVAVCETRPAFVLSCFLSFSCRRRRCPKLSLCRFWPQKEAKKGRMDKVNELYHLLWPALVCERKFARRRYCHYHCYGCSLLVVVLERQLTLVASSSSSSSGQIATLPVVYFFSFWLAYFAGQETLLNGGWKRNFAYPAHKGDLKLIAQ